MKHAVPEVESWTPTLLRFSAWMESIPRPASTVYIRTYHLRRFAADTGVPPAEVTHELLVEYLAGHRWAESTMHAVRSSFKSFFRWAHRVDKSIAENPTELLPSKSPTSGQPRPASDDALDQALHGADDRVRLMLLLGARVGLRCCEICKVHSRDLFQDFDGWSIRVLGKGRRERIIPLSRAIALELRACPPGYVFPGNVDGHLSAGYVSKLISAALPDGVTAHMLRHRFASRAYQADRDIRAVQRLLGHASVNTTQIYTHVPAAALRAAVESAA